MTRLGPEDYDDDYDGSWSWEDDYDYYREDRYEDYDDYDEPDNAFSWD